MKPCLSRNLKDKIRISQQKKKKEQTISRGCPELALGTHGPTRGWALIIEENALLNRVPIPYNRPMHWKGRKSALTCLGWLGTRAPKHSFYFPFTFKHRMLRCSTIKSLLDSHFKKILGRGAGGYFLKNLTIKY